MKLPGPSTPQARDLHVRKEPNKQNYTKQKNSKRLRRTKAQLNPKTRSTESPKREGRFKAREGGLLGEKNQQRSAGRSFGEEEGSSHGSHPVELRDQTQRELGNGREASKRAKGYKGKPTQAIYNRLAERARKQLRQNVSMIGVVRTGHVLKRKKQCTLEVTAFNVL